MVDTITGWRNKIMFLYDRYRQVLIKNMSKNSIKQGQIKIFKNTEGAVLQLTVEYS